MSFHRFVDRAGVIEAFQALGFEGPEEAARFRSADLLYRHLLDKAGGDSTGPQFRELAQRYRKARHLAGRLEGAGRDLVGLHDPATSMLRHAGAPAIRSPLSGDVLADSPVRYVRPDSIQSSQSPARLSRVAVPPGEGGDHAGPAAVRARPAPPGPQGSGAEPRPPRPRDHDAAARERDPDRAARRQRDRVRRGVAHRGAEEGASSLRDAVRPGQRDGARGARGDGGAEPQRRCRARPRGRLRARCRGVHPWWRTPPTGSGSTTSTSRCCRSVPTPTARSTACGTGCRRGWAMPGCSTPTCSRPRPGSPFRSSRRCLASTGRWWARTAAPTPGRTSTSAARAGGSSA